MFKPRLSQEILTRISITPMCSLLCNISSVIFTYDIWWHYFLMWKYCLNLKQYILSDLPNTFVNQSVLKYIQNRYFVHPKVTTPPTITLSLFYVQYKIVQVSNPIWSRCRHPWSWRLDDDNMKIFKAGHKYNILPGAGAGQAPAPGCHLALVNTWMLPHDLDTLAECRLAPDTDTFFCWHNATVGYGPLGSHRAVTACWYGPRGQASRI